MTLPRLYPILDTGALERRAALPADVARVWLEAGVRILQFRHKGPWRRDVLEAAQEVARLCREFGALAIVDDRADYALLAGAGLHVGQDDLAPADARRLLGPSAVIGYSSHNAEQLRAAAGEPVDYLALGPVFATGSKENPDPVMGLDGLRAWRPLAARPLVAIGGVTRANAPDVLEAGADSVAVIADLLPEPCTMESLRVRIKEWLQRVGM
jgi:thiamine-phosphate pyrophosphorylase